MPNPGLEGKSGLVRYLANTSWLLGHRVVQSIVGLLLVVWVARYLGPERFGLLSYAQSFSVIFIAISKLGLDTIVVRELVKGDEGSDLLLGSAFVLKVLGGLASMLFMFTAILLVPTTSYEKLLIILVTASVLFQAFGVIDFFFQSKVLSRYVVIANTFVLTLSSLLKVLLIVLQSPLEYFAAVSLFDGAVMALSYCYMYKHVGGVFKSWRFSPKVAINLLKDSWPLVFSVLLVSIYTRIDQLMIKHMLDVQSVGQYAAAVKISEAWYFLPATITASVFPAIVRARKESPELYCKRLQALYDFMVWLAILVCVPVIIFSQLIVDLLYGESYEQAAGILSVLICASIFGNIGLVSNRYFAAENLQKQVLYRSLVGVTMNVVLNYLLIRRFGLIGAAVALVATQFATSLVYTFIEKSTRPIFLMSIRAFDLKRVLTTATNWRDCIRS